MAGVQLSPVSDLLDTELSLRNKKSNRDIFAWSRALLKSFRYYAEQLTQD